MSYSAWGVAFIGFKIPKHLAIGKKVTDHACSEKLWNPEKFRFCPDCGEVNTPKEEEVCIFSPSDEQDRKYGDDWSFPFKREELDVDQDDSGNLYVGKRIVDYNNRYPIIEENIKRIQQMARDYVESVGIDLKLLPYNFQFGLYVFTKESY